MLLFSFYITDFQLVGYIPKPAFSSMLVLSFMDLIYPWFYQSYFKTKDKSEWMVVPTIVLCAFIFDLLTAVFLGIAFSTFIFVGSFFRSGMSLMCTESLDCKPILKFSIFSLTIRCCQVRRQRYCYSLYCGEALWQERLVDGKRRLYSNSCSTKLFVLWKCFSCLWLHRKHVSKD